MFQFVSAAFRLAEMSNRIYDRAQLSEQEQLLSLPFKILDAISDFWASLLIRMFPSTPIRLAP
jgi:hypothetical protein